MVGNFDIFINYCPFCGYENLSKGYISRRYCTFFNETMLLCHKMKAIDKIIQKHGIDIHYCIMGCKDMQNSRCAIDNKIEEMKSKCE